MHNHFQNDDESCIIISVACGSRRSRYNFELVSRKLVYAILAQYDTKELMIFLTSNIPSVLLFYWPIKIIKYQHKRRILSTTSNNKHPKQRSKLSTKLRSCIMLWFWDPMTHKHYSTCHTLLLYIYYKCIILIYYICGTMCFLPFCCWCRWLVSSFFVCQLRIHWHAMQDHCRFIVFLQILHCLSQRWVEQSGWHLDGATYPNGKSTVSFLTAWRRKTFS